MSTISNVLIKVRVEGAKAVQEIGQVSSSLAVLSGALALVAKNVIKTALEFEKQMRNVNSIAQLTEEQFNKLVDSVRKLGSDPSIKDSPVNLAKGMYQLVSSGFDAEEALKHVAVASKAASAGLTNTETAVTALASQMNAYNKKSLKDSIDFSDQLFRVVDKGVISFEQLASNLGSVNAVASASGVSFKEVGAGFIELTRSGINASEAETAIANLIRSIASPSEEAASYAKLLGVELGDTALQTKGLAGVMADLSKATNGSLSIMSKLIPEARAAKAALTLTKDGANGYTRALEEMNTAGGATNKALSQQSKSLAFELDKLKSSVENLKIEYGNLINDALKDLMPYFRYFVDYLLNLDDNTKRIILNTGLWITAIGAASLAIKGLTLVTTALINTALKHPYLVGAAIAFTAINEAVTALKNSTNEWAKALGSVLEKLDLINLAKQGFEAQKAQLNLQMQEKALLNEKTANLKTIQELTKKELELKKQGKQLDSIDQKKFSQALAGNITFASNGEARTRLKAEALERMKLSKELDSLDAEKAKKDKINADNKSLENKKRLEALELQAKRQKEIDEENERKRKEYESNRKQGLIDIVNIEETTALSIKQNTLEKYAYDREVALKEKNDKIKDLKELQKYNIDTSQARALVELEYKTAISKINSDELKEKQEKNKKELEDLKQLNRQKRDLAENAQDFIDNLTGKSSKIGATDKEKAQASLNIELKELNRNYKKTLESLGDAEDATGKKLFSKKFLDEYSTNFAEALKEFYDKQKAEIEKIDVAKPSLNAIKNIRLELEDLNEKDYSTIGARLEAEKEKWQKINKITKEALLQKAKLTEEDVKTLEDIEKESNKILTKDDKELLKLKLDGNQRLAESIKNLALEFDFLDSKAIGSTMSLLNFSEKGIKLTDSFTKSIEALQEGGFKGLQDFAQSGGDLTGLQTFFQMAIEASKKFTKAIQDNIRELKNLDDIGSFTSDVAGDLVNNLTFGASGAVDKYFGRKTFAEKKKEAIELKELQISMMQDRKAQIEATFTNEMAKIKASTEGEELKAGRMQAAQKEREKDLNDYYEKEKELAEKLHSEKMALAVELSRLGHKLQEVNNTEADNLILKAQDDLLELETTKDSLQVKELKRLEIIQTLQESLRKMKEDYFSDISSLMSKYYEKELQNIKGNHKAEYDLIRVNENKIKDNQDKINSLNEELDKINKEFDKRLSDKNLSAEASKSFATARNNLMSANGGNDVTALVRMSPSELERSIAAQKEEIDLEYAKTGNLEKRSEALKALAVKQNVYWSELAKTLVKGTKEYDSYIKNANDSFREYKSSVKDSIEVQKENRLETSKLTQEIESLTNENKTLQSQVTQANNTVNKDIEQLTAKFKTSTGEWITDINKARTALQGLSVDSQQAIASLNKIQANNTAASQNVSGLTSAGLGTPKTTEALATFKDALPNETMSAYIARVTKEDAMKEQARLNALKSNSQPSVSQTQATTYGVADFSQSKPIAQTPSLASASITSATTTEKGWFDKGGALGWVNPMNWFADGGIANGSISGYPAMLHGKELVLNERQGDNLAYILKMANNKPNMVNNSNSNIVYSTTINGTNLSQKELEMAITNSYKTMQQNNRRAY